MTFQISVVCTVMGFGLKATFADLLYLLRLPSLLARSLMAVFVVMPALVVALDRGFDFPPTVEIALVALAISPLPPRLPARESKAGGHHSYGLGLMVLLAVLSVGLVPLAAQVLGEYFGHHYAVAPAAIARVIGTTVLAPLAVGVVVRLAAPGVAETIANPVAVAAKVIMSLAALALLIVAAPALWQLLGDGTILAIVAFLVVGFAVGHVFGGPEPGHAAVLAFSTACRHPGIALSIAATNFPDQRFGATILLYLITSFVLGLAYTAWQRRRAARTEAG
ncbi:membrane transporter protein [Mycobacterium sp.]|uniref:bile acid:sodium symporter family protein n=1 Tax=Mycobacterium sp. TaxID=1785 RepID=UPI002BCE0872|nr:membrane transporter protein [Mycobacterium sp.]HME49300.1 membrane transporter protein [Mycobacterium sp.]